MKLYFVRHGETEWNVKKKIQGKTDIPLNENGIRQAKELACQLVEEDISVKHVYHSCLLYTSDAADEEDSVDLGGSRITKKKQKKYKQ